MCTRRAAWDYVAVMNLSHACLTSSRQQQEERERSRGEEGSCVAAHLCSTVTSQGEWRLVKAQTARQESSKGGRERGDIEGRVGGGKREKKEARKTE